MSGVEISIAVVLFVVGYIAVSAIWPARKPEAPPPAEPPAEPKD